MEPTKRTNWPERRVKLNPDVQQEELCGFIREEIFYYGKEIVM